MASCSTQLISVELTNPESNKTYTITVTEREFERLQTDATFASLKLEEAENLEYARFISETDAEEPEGSESDLNGSIEESMRNPSEDSAFKWPHEAILLLLDEYEKRQNDFNSGRISKKNCGWTLVLN
ncbi:hypothetical protein WA026_011536 [Henosepilachna vigintioctopunctata]|uniref:Uncharacterized protein n=1 Tax=Henosepilachna vigintioctopunctata TaxID=420089 RepID=A0AAW1TSY3_9CUCU